jgi:hypothetical protein
MTTKFDNYISGLVSKFGEKEVGMGMEMEKEHDDITKGDKKKRAKIVKAHLKEKPDYYTRLKKYVEK